MMRVRIILGTILIIVIGALLVLDKVVFEDQFGFFHPFFFEIISLVVIILGLREFYTLVRGTGVRPMVPYGIAGAAFIYVFFLLSSHSALENNDFLHAFIYVIMVTAVGALFRDKPDRALGDFSVTLVGIIYVCLFYLFIIKIRFLENGLWKLFIFLGAVKAFDIGAYFSGTWFGRKKLSPRLSPKKTVEGVIGGLAFCLVITFLLNAAMGVFGTILKVTAFAISMAVLAQVGDLVESLFKRDAGATHSGKLFPGLGGLLDIIDSFLLSAPIAYLFLK